MSHKILGLLMFDVETLLLQRYPHWGIKQPLFAKPLVVGLRRLFHEKELRQLELDDPNLEGFDFVDKVLDYFAFDYRLRDQQWRRIPAQGKLVIVANHPIGTLDGLALLKLVRKVRPDVKVVANNVLAAVTPLQPVILPVDNMSGRTTRKCLTDIRHFLENEGALIIFPAGEVSRLGPKGVCDGQWQHGFLRIASACAAPVLPIHIDGRNSAFFYALSFLAKPLSTLWLFREMFKQTQRCVDIRIGEPISYKAYRRINLPLRDKADLFKQHLYRVGNGKPGIFSSVEALANPELRIQLRNEILLGELLGETADNKQIYLYRHRPDSCVMREIGRLRELSFRAVDEGTGQDRDLDSYDQHYFHLVLWDDEAQEIVGAYRLCEARNASSPKNYSHLYSASLFDFSTGMNAYFERGLELGRSFVQPKYWGNRSLDYLWCGIGMFLRKHPEYRYLFGPVSLSDAYPAPAKDMLIFFYQRHFKPLQPLATARQPYLMAPSSQAILAQQFPGLAYHEEFARLKQKLAEMNLKVPPLYKQYSELCDPGGVQFAAFNIDTAFADCVDGFMVVDLARLKPARRKRYLG